MPCMCSGYGCTYICIKAYATQAVNLKYTLPVPQKMLGRFLEKAYRGEVQTKIIGGLRIYQWLALLPVLVGAILTCFTTAVTPSWQSILWSPQQLDASLYPAFLVFFLMGIDFTAST